MCVTGSWLAEVCRRVPRITWRSGALRCLPQPEQKRPLGERWTQRPPGERLLDYTTTIESNWAKWEYTIHYNFINKDVSLHTTYKQLRLRLGGAWWQPSNSIFLTHSTNLATHMTPNSILNLKSNVQVRVSGSFRTSQLLFSFSLIYIQTTSVKKRG